jgi:hypothetical protein
VITIATILIGTLLGLEGFATIVVVVVGLIQNIF